MRRGAGIRRAALCAGLAAGLACRGAEEPRPSGPAMRAEPGPGGNTAPRIEVLRLEPAEPVAGARVRAVVAARDAEGDPLELRYDWEVAGDPQASGESAIQLSESIRRGDRVAVRVTVSDGTLESQASAEATVGNRSPEMQSLVTVPLREIPLGGSVQIEPRAVDPEGDRLEFETVWFVNGQAVEASGSELPTAGLAAGDEIRARVVARDGGARSAPMQSGIVRVVEANAPPRILSSPSGVGPGGTFHYRLEAEDPEGDDQLQFRLTQAPEGMTIDGDSGEIHWSPRGRAPGVYAVEVVVRDSGGAASAQAFELTVASGDQPPASTP